MRLSTSCYLSSGRARFLSVIVLFGQQVHVVVPIFSVSIVAIGSDDGSIEDHTCGMTMHTIYSSFLQALFEANI